MRDDAKGDPIRLPNPEPRSLPDATFRKEKEGATGFRDADFLNGTRAFDAGGNRSADERPFGPRVRQAASVAMRALEASDSLDTTIRRAGQAGGLGIAEQTALRQQILRLARVNGNGVDALAGALSPIASARPPYAAYEHILNAVDVATTITGIDPSVFASQLLTVGSALGVDFAKPGEAIGVTRTMLSASRKGSASVDLLTDSYSRVAPGLLEALGRDQALAVTSVLAEGITDPGRLADITSGFARIFGVDSSKGEVERATGVPLFGSDGSKRQIIDVFKDIRTKYDTAGSEQAKRDFLVNAFPDVRTREGMRYFLENNGIEKMQDVQKDIAWSPLTTAVDFAANRQSTSAVAGRAKNTLREGVDSLVQPLNKALGEFGSKLLDDTKLSGGQILAIGAGGAAAAYAAKRYVPGLGNLAGLLGGANTAGNLAMGKALEQMLGITPVFVTNWPSFGGQGPSSPFTVPGKDGSGRGRGGSKGSGKGTKAMVFRALTRRAARAPGPLKLAAIAVELLADNFGGSPSDNQDQGTNGHSIEEMQSAQDSLGTGAPSIQFAPPLDDGIPRRAPTNATPSSVSNQAEIASLTAVVDAFSAALSAFAARPLQIKVQTDVPWLYAELGDHIQREGRRGE